ncbi:MAG: single-stranded-DNA-specific exonuclease RecJ, partial [Pseudomonadota bacterium]|nr:single-stranded-DNA-specific exonuclease RecJ [Pseudomonadota bacterium]
MDAVLNVDHSFTGKNWRSRVDGDEVARDRRATALAQRLDLPAIVAQILADREIELDQAEAYLAPTLRDLLPDPSSFRDMDQAVARLVRAIGAGEKIAVFGDYDVDGATSSALLLRFMRAVGGDIQAYIPDRIAEGYGPNAPALLKLAADGVRVVVTVDCGITAFEPLAAAAQAGLDVIVLDHHVAEPQLPTAVAVVNPNRFDENAGHGYLAAVGVCFLTTIALNRALRAAGHYQGRAEPNLLQWLDLVALGTVADVVPLVGLNRAFVQQGLKVLAGRRNTGLSALADVAGLDSRPEAYHLGFVLGPRVNAGGRVGEAGLGTRLLAADDPAEAAELARRLDAYNGDRRAIEAEVLTAAVTQAEAAGAAATSLVMVGDAGWHPGVIGIVAARLRERFGVPACVIAWDGAVGKGSGRSVPGVALGPAVLAAQQAGLLINGGGHAMAAGFTVARDRFADFQAFMTERIEAALAAAPLTQRLNIDAVVTPGGANR